MEEENQNIFEDPSTNDLRLVFNHIDIDHNGTIEIEELASAIRRVDPGLDNHLVALFFQQMGVSKKSLTFDEFSSLLCQYLPENIQITNPQHCVDIKVNLEGVPMINGINLETYITPLSTNPIQFNLRNFISNHERVLESCIVKDGEIVVEDQNYFKSVRQFIRAGPRAKIAFNASDVKAAIVTCGGLCPGLNTVIRELVHCLETIYYVSEIYGIRYGYEGFYTHEIVELTTKIVASIHHNGGTILGSSRGGFNLHKIVDSIQEKGINQVYIIGGDGTHRGAQEIYLETERRGMKVAVACCPKTIDNDFQLIDRSFGFATAVEEAQKAITSAKVEADGVENGIGLVKLMGRQSGFIAMNSSLASRDVDYCLIPEVPFHLTTLLRHLKYSLKEKSHVVIVVAEGAGAHLGASGLRDKSGNPILLDVGVFLKKAISEYFKQEGIDISVKYIDPTYMIRSVPPNANDSIYCSLLAHNAVHGAMAGYTGFTVGLINNHYVYLPIQAVTTAPKTVNPKGRKWFRLMESTRQPDFSNISNIFISLAEAIEKKIKQNQISQ